MSTKIHSSWRTVSLILIALTVIAAWFEYQRIKDHQKADHAQHSLYFEESVNHNKALARYDSLLEHEKREMDSWVAAATRTIDKQDVIIARLRRQLSSVPEIIEADSMPFTRAQLEFRDSIISGQDTVIQTLKTERALVSRLEIAEDSIQEMKLGAWVKYSSGLEDKVDSLATSKSKQDKKWRRKRRAERFIEGLVIIGIVILAI
jgi:hypothetical protein